MRFAVIIGLVLSLLLLGEAALQSWKAIEIPGMPEVSLKKKGPPAPLRQLLEVNPRVPVLMPDLNTGYLFNAQRSISEQEGEEATAGESATEPQSQVNMDTLVYAGSIIIDHLRKGMVSFSLKEEQAPAVSARRLGRYRIQRQVNKVSTQYETVDEGDDFYGFKVASVQPDRIIFSKNGTTIEKMLYDPNKERTGTPSPNRPTVAGGPAGAGAANEGAAAVPLPRPAGQPGTVTPSPPRPEGGTTPAVSPRSPTPAVLTPGIRTPSRRPHVIQRVVCRYRPDRRGACQEGN